MRLTVPLPEPLRITRFEDAVVFLGGEGLTFSMTLPAARDTLRRLADALTAPVVLLVEDEPSVRQMGVDALREAGYAVIPAECAADALAALEHGATVHLLFTDIHLPGKIDGLQLAHMVSRRWPSVRLLVCSGRTRPGPRELPAEVPFLPKPYIAAEMLRRVNELTTV